MRRRSFLQRLRALLAPRPSLAETPALPLAFCEEKGGETEPLSYRSGGSRVVSEVSRLWERDLRGCDIETLRRDGVEGQLTAGAANTHSPSAQAHAPTGNCVLSGNAASPMIVFCTRRSTARISRLDLEKLSARGELESRKRTARRELRPGRPRPDDFG